MSKGQKESPKGDVSQSALFYLFQEVSRLSSPAHHSLMETDCVWLDSDESVHCSSSSLTPQETYVQSPLKLLNLIDRQCERLLKKNEDEEQDRDSLLISDFGNSNVSLVPPNVEPTKPFNHDNTSDNHFKDYCVEDAAICSNKTIVIEKTKPDYPEKHEETARTSQTPVPKFTVALDLNKDWTEECVSTQCTFYDFLPEHHCTEHINDAHTLLTSNDEVQKPSLDYNANISLNLDKTVNNLESDQSKFCKSSNSLQQQPSDVQGNTASTCEESSGEIPKPSAKNGLTNSSSLEKDSCVPHTVQHSTWRSKSRKQPCPSRSVSAQDLGFQGVMFRMDTELDDSKDQCQLLITSKFSADLPKCTKSKRLRTTKSHKCLKTSSDEDSDSATSDAKSKVCASCSTSKTPMWRDAENGTPLCNACGIRYKKYRVRCTNCWHIPKKEGNSVSRCSKCGHVVVSNLRGDSSSNTPAPSLFI